MVIFGILIFKIIIWQVNESKQKHGEFLCKFELFHSICCNLENVW